MSFLDSDRTARRLPGLRVLLAPSACLAALCLFAGASKPALVGGAGRPAPELPRREPSHWINSKPLTLEALKGEVVLIEIWTFG